MLSRRRSSEQTALHPPLQSSPSLLRLETSLRGVHVLFSAIAHPDTPTAAPTSSHVTSPSSDLPPSPTSSSPQPPQPPQPNHDQVPARRRLFSRDPRVDRARRGSPAVPPIHRLVVTASTKNPAQIRLFQLLDYPSVPRVSVSRAWNLSDLRKIDGLGLPVADSLRFGLFFASGKMLVWRTQTPLSRATFLWALLQICASKLKRAPPVQNLGLLELQTFTENPTQPTPTPDPDDDESSSINYPPSDRSNIHVASSLDELHDTTSDHVMSSRVHSPHSSIIHPLHNHSRVINHSSQDAFHPPSPSKPPINLAPVTLNPSSQFPLHRPTSPNRASNPPARSNRDPAQSQRVIRALSEPKVSAANPKRSEASQVASTFARKPETIAPVHPMPDPKSMDMNMDERAFRAAAKRMGAKQSSPMCKAEILEQFANVGAEVNARTLQHRLDISNCGTGKTISERRLNQELNLYRLTKPEQQDLSFTLDLFFKDSPHPPSLSDFGCWIESQVQTLEVENIADIVSAEERGSNVLSEAEGHKEACNPYDVLMNSVMQVEPWLEKNETLLAPYASLADDINNEVILLELQRKNVFGMEAQLDELLKAITFKQKEQELINDLDTMELSSDPVEVNYTEFYQAVEVVSEKVEALSTLSNLSDMSAVTQVRQLIAEKQSKASKALLPCLQKFLTVQYRVAKEDDESFGVSAEDVQLNTAEVITSHVFSEFFKGARCLFMCGNNSFAELIDHYVSASASWITSVSGFIMGENRNVLVKKDNLDNNAMNMLESIFYACLAEGFRAFRLFASILASSSDQGDATTLSAILRRQIPDVSFIEKSTSEIAGGQNVCQVCLLLHFSYSLDVFARRLATNNAEQLKEMVGKIEAQIGLEPSPPSAVGFSYRRNWFDARNSEAIPWSRSPTAVYARPTRSNSLSPDGRVVSEFLSNFLTVCEQLSSKCYSLVGKQVAIVISQMAAPRDISDALGRGTFFSRVKESVDLCRELASPTFQGPADVATVGSKTRSLCEKLIAAAMRNTEVASASGPKNCGDIVKLQCYGYIAALLADSEEDFLIQLAHLSSRVRKHIMKKWAEDHVFDVVLGGLNVEMVKRSSSAGQIKLRECVAALKASEAATSMKKLIDAGMESAAETCAIVPLYNELVLRTKERMEEVLRHVRKDKSISDMRPRLLAFSRELLAILRGELKKSQTRFSGQTSASPL